MNDVKAHATFVSRLTRKIKKQRTRYEIQRARVRSLRAVRQRDHGLPGKLFISLTSYPARYQWLLPTLKCLLMQSVRPDGVILWIADGEDAALPDEILRLQSKGLTIRTCTDYKSYNKIVHSLGDDRSCFYVVADDDMYYPRGWLAGLVSGYRGRNNEIVCYKAREAAEEGGEFLPYKRWPAVRSETEPSPSLMAIGSAGVLYPPHSLPSETVDAATFTRLAPTGDDLWLYWMARKAGSSVKVTPNPDACYDWPDYDGATLQEINIGGGRNDLQIAALASALGRPY